MHSALTPRRRHASALTLTLTLTFTLAFTLTFTPRAHAGDLTPAAHYDATRTSRAQRKIGIVLLVAGAVMTIVGIAVTVDGTRAREEPQPFLEPRLCTVEGPCGGDFVITKREPNLEIVGGGATLGAGAVLTGFGIPLVLGRF